MSQFSDMLRERLGRAQVRLQETQNSLQIAQAQHQMAVQEITSLQTLINLENNRDQEVAREQRAVVPPAVPPRVPITVSSTPASVAPRIVVPPVTARTASRVILSPRPATVDVGGTSQTESKTDLIRDILRKFTNGINPAQVWVESKGAVDRPYVYSVLKRMKDKGEVIERGGKYYLQVSQGDGQ